jgi:hypothetical protein
MTDDQIIERPRHDIELPARMRGLKRDHRGFVVPYFVSWFEAGVEVEPGRGTPDFRVLSPARMARCKRERRCWLCGAPMGRYLAFAIGPMCAITRTTLEPPGHYECAHYSVRVCPFLSRPRMRRNDVDMPEGHWSPGLVVPRNPGVTALWITRGYSTFRVDGNAEAGIAAGELITVGDPERVEWWREGRRATRAEVMESITSGLPLLREAADKQGERTRRDLEEFYIPRLDQHLPPPP